MGQAPSAEAVEEQRPDQVDGQTWTNSVLDEYRKLRSDSAASPAPGNASATTEGMAHGEPERDVAQDHAQSSRKRAFEAPEQHVSRAGAHNDASRPSQWRRTEMGMPEARGSSSARWHPAPAVASASCAAGPASHRPLPLPPIPLSAASSLDVARRTRPANGAAGVNHAEASDGQSPGSLGSGNGAHDIFRLEAALASLYDSMDPASLQLKAALRTQSSESDRELSPRGPREDGADAGSQAGADTAHPSQPLSDAAFTTTHPSHQVLHTQTSGSAGGDDAALSEESSFTSDEGTSGTSVGTSAYATPVMHGLYDAAANVAPLAAPAAAAFHMSVAPASRPLASGTPHLGVSALPQLRAQPILTPPGYGAPPGYAQLYPPHQPPAAATPEPFASGGGSASYAYQLHDAEHASHLPPHMQYWPPPTVGAPSASAGVKYAGAWEHPSGEHATNSVASLGVASLGSGSGSALGKDREKDGEEGGNSRELTRKPWLGSEDQTILDSVASMGFKWRLIAAMLPGRSDDAVRNRWNRLQEAMRDGNPARLLGTDRPKAGYKCSKCGQLKRNHVCTFQPGSAAAQAAAAAKPARQVSAEGDKLRGLWSKHEDDTIRTFVSRVGPRWALIAAELPGRTEHAVRNRWHRLQNLDSGSAVPSADGGIEEFDEYLDSGGNGVTIDGFENVSASASACGYDEETQRQLGDLIQSPGSEGASLPLLSGTSPIDGVPDVVGQGRDISSEQP